MAIQWLDDYNNLPPSFTLTEQHNPKVIKDAIDHPLTNKKTRTELATFLATLPENGIIKVKYDRGVWGRYQPTTYCSTRMWRRVRSESLPANYIDIDAVTCFPSIMVHLAKLHGIAKSEYNHIEAYSKDKSKYIDNLNITDDDIESHCSIAQDILTKKDIGKLVYNMFCFGAGTRAFKKLGILNPFPKSGISTDFKRQWKALSDSIVKQECYEHIIEYAKKHKADKSERYHAGCAISLICQTFEALIVYRLMQKVGLDNIKTYEFDGIIVDIDPNPILENLDLPLNFIVKPRADGISTIDDDDLPEPPPETKSGDTIEWFTHAEAAQKILDLYPNKFIVVDNAIWFRQGILYTNKLVDKRLLKFITSLPLRYGERKTRKHEMVSDACNIRKALDSSILSTFENQTKSQICRKWIGCICFRNGYIDLRKGEFNTYGATDIALHYINVDYEPNTNISENTMRNVDTILSCLGGNKQYYLHLVCRAMAGHCDKVWAILTGSRDSGKSLLQKLFELTDGYYGHTEPLLIGDQSDLARVIGTHIIAGGDTPGVMFTNEAKQVRRQEPVVDGQLLKLLQSGGDPVQARRLCQDPFETVFLKMITMCFNDVPEIRPPDALQNCKIFNMPYVYVDNSILEQSGPNARAKDLTLEPYLRENKLQCLHYLISLLVYNYKWNGEVPNLGPDESIKSIGKDSVFRNRFIVDADGYLPKNVVQDILLGIDGLTITSLGRYLHKRWGVIAIEKNVDGKRIKCYKGLSPNPKWVSQEDSDDPVTPPPDACVV